MLSSCRSFLSYGAGAQEAGDTVTVAPEGEYPVTVTHGDDEPVCPQWSNPAATADNTHNVRTNQQALLNVRTNQQALLESISDFTAQVKLLSSLVIDFSDFTNVIEELSSLVTKLEQMPTRPQQQGKLITINMIRQKPEAGLMGTELRWALGDGDVVCEDIPSCICNSVPRSWWGRKEGPFDVLQIKSFVNNVLETYQAHTAPMEVALVLDAKRGEPMKNTDCVHMGDELCAITRPVHHSYLRDAAFIEHSLRGEPFKAFIDELQLQEMPPTSNQAHHFTHFDYFHHQVNCARARYTTINAFKKCQRGARDLFVSMVMVVVSKNCDRAAFLHEVNSVYGAYTTLGALDIDPRSKLLAAYSKLIPRGALEKYKGPAPTPPSAHRSLHRSLNCSLQHPHHLLIPDPTPRTPPPPLHMEWRGGGGIRRGELYM